MVSISVIYSMLKTCQQDDFIFKLMKIKILDKDTPQSLFLERVNISTTVNILTVVVPILNTMIRVYWNQSA